MPLCATDGVRSARRLRVSILVERVTCPHCLAAMSRYLAAQRNAAEVTHLDTATKDHKA